MNKEMVMNKILLRWFKKHGRDLPWRNTRDPYEIFISEMMLQQTQVGRVLGKYKSFLEEFPTVKSLASAPLRSVLKAWSGLGYNRRAKYINECAKIICVDYGGKFPTSFDKLLTLPGIGRSTAAAIMAFAFHAPEPMIDTNIRRVFCRIFFPEKIPSDSIIYDFAKGMMPKKNPHIWNWAMLDIGALYCKARGHREDCPLQKLHGKVKDFIYKKPQAKFKDSKRYYRGQILKALANTLVGLVLEDLEKILGNKQGLEEIVGDLCSEGLVMQERGKVRLP